MAINTVNVGEAHQHLQQAQSLLASPIKESKSASVKRCEVWMNTRGNVTFTSGEFTAVLEVQDHLMLALHQLGRLGEMNDASPQFWWHLSAAAQCLQIPISQKMEADLREGSKHLQRIESNFETEDIVSHARQVNVDEDVLQKQYLHMALFSIAEQIISLQQALRHHRLTDDQQLRYFELLRRFKPFFVTLVEYMEGRRLVLDDSVYQALSQIAD